MNRIGLFGGSFNPPHIGHLLIAKNVLKEFSLNNIIFIPAYIPPHKQNENLANAEHRLNMVKLLIKEEKDFIVSDYELKKFNISYTIDTVKYFKSELIGKELFFIVGSDNFYYIETWKNYLELINIIKFIVYLRKNFTKEMIALKHKSLINKVLWSKSEIIDISASEIRQKIKRGEDCIKEVGKDVWDYIKKNNLYKI